MVQYACDAIITTQFVTSFFMKTMTLKIVLWLFAMNSNATMSHVCNLKKNRQNDSKQEYLIYRHGDPEAVKTALLLY